MDVRGLIRDVLPEALGGLIATAVILLISWLLKVHHRRQRGRSFSVENTDREQKIGQYAIVIAFAAVGCLALILEVIGPAVSKHFISAGSIATIRTHRWITYDPPGSWEWKYGTHFDLSASSIPRIDMTRKELKLDS